VTGLSTSFTKTNIDRKPVKMTPNLQILQQCRASKTEQEVEEEFKKLAAERKAATKI
jgi:hypothetical protein